MQNRFLDNKVVLKYCPDYYRIINEEFNELDYMSDKIIQVFQQYIFSIDIRNKNDIKKISSLNKAIVRYFDDREFKTILTNFLLALKVPKGTKNVVSIIVDNIIEQHLKYMEGFTRNIYIPRWI
ncbi:unknown [Clostridium sp. CAG:1000]|jgi:hypothetical protein|nr:hypothetical protein [Clostridium sp.]CCX36588.1 unknown [Clostridium sp. CAG:1000]